MIFCLLGNQTLKNAMMHYCHFTLWQLISTYQLNRRKRSIIHFRAEHIPGLLNTAADLLSRLQIQQFKDQYPKMDRRPTAVPQELLHL